ncbi:sensor domain-containing diguanylate cyclase [Aneurinibacillus sp. Ricciae_BoGa-3]|uniref:sensor domain-containing diguanylate cyclase n=1 Tax=Aneurinibacillus sp. Ricciae_BoGa-3 TaxID=3022697 RepID=UPI002340475D|nr:sensor domain-containing diguanylate cyclase [Aneurinibacillus sp. Ricciae_BoGa-3]WCK55777.1 sensor domain-containing diguanylate cyclase [Aneurinibacillus sp. Ricciae_BoGa-3]
MRKDPSSAITLGCPPENKLAHVFQSCISEYSADSMPLANGCFFIASTAGEVVAVEQTGQSLFEFDYPLTTAELAGNYIDEIKKIRVLSQPVIVDGINYGFIGALMHADDDANSIAAFILGLLYSIRYSLRDFLQQQIDGIIEEISQERTPYSLMGSLVHRLAVLLGKGDCAAALFNGDQRSILTCWFSNEDADRSNKQALYDNSSLIYHQLCSFRQQSDTQKVLIVELGMPAQTYWIFPLYSANRILGFFAFSNTENIPYTAVEIDFIRRVIGRATFGINNMYFYQKIQQDEEKRNKILEITKKIHSSIDVDDVLRAVVDNTLMLYPDLRVNLWVSHDSHSSNLHIKQFNFYSEDCEVSVRAFMQAETIVVTQGEKLTLAAPLRGNQGVYGVLELNADNLFALSDREIPYISMIADSAGNAFENAQLYKQSRNVIRELLLINEVTQQLNKSLKLKDVLSFITKKLMETFDAEYACILRKHPNEDVFTVQAATNEEHIGERIDGSQNRLRQISEKKESVILADLPAGERPCQLFTFRSFMGVPLLLGGEHVEGAVIVMDSKPHYFTFDDFKLLELLAQHMNLAMANASLHAEVERMVITDNLTGLFNRKYLYDHIQSSMQHDGFGSLILIDLDHFKSINDTYGHQTGDKILIQVADILQKSVRGTDVAARWGGEELALYLPTSSIKTALAVAERVRRKVMEITEPRITISSGISVWSEKDEKNTVDTLFQSADEALYKAKNNGRNQIVIA